MVLRLGRILVFVLRQGLTYHQNVIPLRGVIRTLLGSFNGIGKVQCLSLCVFFLVLLRSEYYCLSAVLPVNVVNHLIQTLHLLVFLSVIILEIGLNTMLPNQSHKHNAGAFIVITLYESLIQTLQGALHDALGAIGWRE